MIQYEFNILMGLPGSGKSYWAKNVFQKANYSIAEEECHIISLDNFVNVDGERIYLKDALFDAYDYEEIYRTNSTMLDRYKIKTHFVCVDGLILTKKNLEEIIEYTMDYLRLHVKRFSAVRFNVHTWNEDRDLCLKNDEYRCAYGERIINSKTTIKNAPYEYITDDVFEQIREYCEKFSKSNYKVRCFMVRHDVHKVTTYDLFEKYDNHCSVYPRNTKSGHMYSSEWSLGGTWGNCWDDELTHVDGDSPKDFTEFDELMEEIAPDIKFMQYKKLYNECVEIQEREECDYYGGRVTYAFHVCDLKKLHNMMLEMGLIKEL